MAVQVLAMKTRLRVEESHEDSSVTAGFREALTPLALRVQGEYREMPGLRLTVSQAARLFGVPPDVAGAVLDELHRRSILACSNDGAYAFIPERSHLRTSAVASDVSKRNEKMNPQIATIRPVNGSLREASVDRLACLLRHWTWADEAMARFDRELANGWDYDDDPMSDHPFGAHHHWCALLCAFGEAALDDGLLSPLQLEPIRQDIEASLPGLRACRQLLVVIPASLEDPPVSWTCSAMTQFHASVGSIARSAKPFTRSRRLARSIRWIPDRVNSS